MRCGFCGHDFKEEDGIRGCGKCGMPHGCTMIRCPRCNYENPPEPTIIKRLKKIFNSGTQGGGNETK